MSRLALFTVSALVSIGSPAAAEEGAGSDPGWRASFETDPTKWTWPLPSEAVT